MDPEAILRTDTFEDVLFIDDTETPVNVLTGVTPVPSQATVEEAKEFAASIDTDTPQIALPASVESQVETQSQSTRRPRSSTSRRLARSKEFERTLEWVKEAIDELSDEEIMRDQDLARHAFHKVGAYDGTTVFLYTEHGTGIRHRGQLDRLLEESEELWIVPADVHF